MTQAKVAHWTFFTEIAKNWHENVEILCCVVALSVIYAQGLVRFFVNLGNFLQLYTQQWLYYYVTEISMWSLRRSKVLYSLIPRPTPKRKGGSSEYILQHFVSLWNFSHTIWLADVAITSPVLGFLTTKHLALLITPLQTYLANPPIYWPSKRLQRLKNPIAKASP